VKDDTLLLSLLEEALAAGLFAPSLVSCHVAAVSYLAGASGEESPSKRQRTCAADGAVSESVPPSSLHQLYSTLCSCTSRGAPTRQRLVTRCVSRTFAGDQGVLTLLPWVLKAFSVAVPGQHNCRLFCALLHSLEESMTQACAEGCVSVWCSSVAAVQRLLTCAYLVSALSAAGVSDILSAHIRLALDQCCQQSTPQASTAASLLLCSFLDVDTRLVDPHTADAWRLSWVGCEHAPAASQEAACRLISAYADTRQLDRLLLTATSSICTLSMSSDHELAGMRATMGSPAVIAAWSAAAARLPSAQCVLVVHAVEQCARCALELEPKRSLSLLGPLAEMQAAVLAGVAVLPPTASAVAFAALSLQSQLNAQPILEDSQPLCAFRLHLATTIWRLADECLVQAGGSQVCDDALACRRAASALAMRDESRWAAEKGIAPWLHLELARAALMRISLLTESDEHDDDDAYTAQRCCERWLAVSEAHCAASWDGITSTISRAALPCALWHLCTEFARLWCVSHGTIRCTLTYPSGAHLQASHFCVDLCWRCCAVLIVLIRFLC
jgi:hypothetical protein